MSRMMEFFVPGLPKTAGSKRAFAHRTTGKIIVTDDTGKPGRRWRADVQAAAAQAYGGPLLTGPLEVTLGFHLPRPKGHYGTGRNAEKLRPSAPDYHTVKPDIDKLSRAVLDALKGVVWRDDAQVWKKLASKRYAEIDGPGVHVRICTSEAGDV